VGQKKTETLPGGLEGKDPRSRRRNARGDLSKSPKEEGQLATRDSKNSKVAQQTVPPKRWGGGKKTGRIGMTLISHVYARGRTEEGNLHKYSQSSKQVEKSQFDER